MGPEEKDYVRMEPKLGDAVWTPVVEREMGYDYLVQRSCTEAIVAILPIAHALRFWPWVLMFLKVDAFAAKNHA